jgi:Zn-dependent protease
VSGPWGPPAAGRQPASNRRTIVIVVLLAIAAVVWLVHRHHISSAVVIYFCVLIPSIILHEVSHGAVANLCGDDTAKRAGRLTLNPIPHIDPFGSIILPAIFVLSNSGIGFGYAKPVPVNVGKLRHPRNQSVIVSLAGPATNAVLFVVAGLLYRVFAEHNLFVSPTTTSLPLVYQVLYEAGLANFILGVFNLIPIPPLDGSAVVERLLPTRAIPRYYRLRPYGMVVVLVFALLLWNRAGISTHIFDWEQSLWSTVVG